MADIKYGATSWDHIKAGGGNKPDKNLWMRLDSGSNQIRIITKPHQYLVHSYKENENDPGFGAKVYCSSFHKSCTLCEEGNKPKRRWLVGVIDRKTQSYKVLDMSVSVFKSIQEFSRDDDYGTPERYDIDVKVDKQGGATGYYTVIPKPPKPMSANDLEIKANADLDDLVKRCTPPTPEKVAERLAFLKAKKDGTAEAKPAPAKSVKNGAAKKAPVVETHSDEDYTFPSAEEN